MQVTYYGSRRPANRGNARSIVSKVNHTREHELGGWSTWSMGSDFVLHTGKPHHPLMAAVADCVRDNPKQLLVVSSLFV